MVEAELNPDNYRTKTLISGLAKGKRLGLSIGGVVKDAALEYWDDIKAKVLTYKDIDIFHVAITGTPAVANTWVGNIHKSVKNLNDLPVTKAADWKCGAAHDLPIIDATWDGQEAKDSIFAWAGWPDKPESAKAKQAFLAYDACSTTIRTAASDH
jgi:hypothetical protein